MNEKRKQMLETFNPEEIPDDNKRSLRRKIYHALERTKDDLILVRDSPMNQIAFDATAPCKRMAQLWKSVMEIVLKDPKHWGKDGKYYIDSLFLKYGWKRLTEEEITEENKYTQRVEFFEGVPIKPAKGSRGSRTPKSSKSRKGKAKFEDFDEADGSDDDPFG